MLVELVDGEHPTLKVEAVQIILGKELFDATGLDFTKTFRDVLLENMEGNTIFKLRLATRRSHGLLEAGQ